MAKDKRKNKEEQEEKKAEPLKPDWKDYLAITIAALETTLLPFIIFAIVILVIAIALGVLFR